jgi:hypothetical protein
MTRSALEVADIFCRAAATITCMCIADHWEFRVQV